MMTVSTKPIKMSEVYESDDKATTATIDCIKIYEREFNKQILPIDTHGTLRVEGTHDSSSYDMGLFIDTPQSVHNPRISEHSMELNATTSAGVNEESIMSDEDVGLFGEMDSLRGRRATRMLQNSTRSRVLEGIPLEICVKNCEEISAIEPLLPCAFESIAAFLLLKENRLVNHKKNGRNHSLSFTRTISFKALQTMPRRASAA